MNACLIVFTLSKVPDDSCLRGEGFRYRLLLQVTCERLSDCLHVEQSTRRQLFTWRRLPIPTTASVTCERLSDCLHVDQSTRAQPSTCKRLRNLLLQVICKRLANCLHLDLERYTGPALLPGCCLPGGVFRHRLLLQVTCERLSDSLHVEQGTRQQRYTWRMLPTQTTASGKLVNDCLIVFTLTKVRGHSRLLEKAYNISCFR